MKTIRPPSDQKIRPRGAHTACTIGHKLYIFGGISPQLQQQASSSSRQDDDYEYLNTLLIFDLQTEAWSTPNIKGTLPQACAGHAAAAAGKYVFVFGGRNGSLLLQDMYMLDTGMLYIWLFYTQTISTQHTQTHIEETIETKNTYHTYFFHLLQLLIRKTEMEKVTSQW